jgi:hypothetical protein
MNGFHGNSKRRSYFEGWYFKQQNETEAFAVIAAFHIDRAGRRSASIQVICADGAWNYDFPGDSFQAERGRLHVTIGENVFS